jgi:hypothetical protein
MGRLVAISAVLISSLVAGPVRAERLKVCTFSYHGPEEVAVFASRLPETDFEILDLSPPSPLRARRSPPRRGRRLPARGL